jgi:hypothetical protein
MHPDPTPATDPGAAPPARRGVDQRTGPAGPPHALGPTLATGATLGPALAEITSEPEPVAVEPLVTVAIGPGDLDTDGDGLPDTVVVVDGPDLLLHTDLDGDGLADQVLHLGPETLDLRDSAPEPSDASPSPWWAPWTWTAES